MRTGFHWPSALIGAAVAALLGMLGFSEPTATAQADRQPLANAAEQRIEMIRLLRDQHALAKEQLELLHSGKLRVIVDPAK